MPVNDKKRAYGARLGDYINEYKQAFLVGCDERGADAADATNDAEGWPAHFEWLLALLSLSVH